MVAPGTDSCCGRASKTATLRTRIWDARNAGAVPWLRRHCARSTATSRSHFLLQKRGAAQCALQKRPLSECNTIQDCTPEQFERHLNEVQRLMLLDGQAPFCKLHVHRNWTSTHCLAIPITDDNRLQLRQRGW